MGKHGGLSDNGYDNKYNSLLTQIAIILGLACLSNDQTITS